MAMHSRRWRAAAQKIEAMHSYPALEAFTLLQEFATAKFEESVDVAVRLGVDPKRSEQAVRGSSQLPHGIGKSVRVAVFAQGEAADQAREAGADLVGHEDLAERFRQEKVDCDCIIATPDCMPLVGTLGRILGPRGLMPNPKMGSITTAVLSAVTNAKKGQVRFRSDRGGVVHCLIGRASFDAGKLQENLEALLLELMKLRPGSVQGTYLRKVCVSTTMSPSLVVEQASLAL